MNKVKIYTLSDPDSGVIRYIGVTKKTLKARLAAHKSSAKNASKLSHKINWFRSLSKSPVIKLIEEVPEEDMWYTEMYWISQFKHWGFNLVNTTEGGETPVTLYGKENPNYGNRYDSNPINKGAIYQLDLEGNLIRMLNCIEAGELYGLDPGCICRCVNKERTQHKGYQFIKNYNPDQDYTFKPYNTQSKTVQKLDLQGNVLEEFPSASAAGGDGVGRVCRGERKTYKGFRWQFKHI